MSSGTLRHQLRRSRRELRPLFPIHERVSDCNAAICNWNSNVHFSAIRLNSTIAETIIITSWFRNENFCGRDRRRFFSSRSKDPSEVRRNRRSPYAVLGLGGSSTKNITEDEIKAAFRRLAKVYHPDLNPENRPIEECETLMSELVDAYERLLRSDDEDYFLENIKVGASNKVALACELYSVQELTMDNFHEVHALQIDYGTEADENSEETELDRERRTNETEYPPSTSLPETAKSIIAPIQAHPGDSVLDLKEDLESEFGEEWKLRNCLGWELLAFKKTKVDSEEDPTTVAVHNEVLSYHLFLEDYQIQHGDIIYAIVRKHED